MTKTLMKSHFRRTRYADDVNPSPVAIMLEFGKSTPSTVETSFSVFATDLITKLNRSSTLEEVAVIRSTRLLGRQTTLTGESSSFISLFSLSCTSFRARHYQYILLICSFIISRSRLGIGTSFKHLCNGNGL